MTGYTVHTGTSKKFVSGWDRIFADGADSEEKSAKKKKGVKASAKSKGKKKKK